MKLQHVYNLDLSDFYNQTFLIIDANDRKSFYNALYNKGKRLYNNLIGNKTRYPLLKRTNVGKSDGIVGADSYLFGIIEGIEGDNTFNKFVQIRTSQSIAIAIPNHGAINRAYITFHAIDFTSKYAFSMTGREIEEELDALVYYLFKENITSSLNGKRYSISMIGRANTSNPLFSTLLELWSRQAQLTENDEKDNVEEDEEETVIKIDPVKKQMIDTLDGLLTNVFKESENGETPLKNNQVRKSFSALELAKFYIEFHEGTFTEETDDIREYIMFEFQGVEMEDVKELDEDNKLKYQVYNILLDSISKFNKIELDDILEKERREQIQTVLKNSGSLSSKHPSIYEVDFKSNIPETRHVKTFVHGTPLKSVASILSTGLKNSEELREMRTKQDKQEEDASQITLDYNFTGTAYGLGVYFSNLSNASQSLGYTGRRTQILLVVDYFYDDEESDFTRGSHLHSNVVVGTKSQNAIIKYIIAWDKE